MKTYTCSYCGHTWQAEGFEAMDCKCCGALEVNGISVRSELPKNQIETWIRVGRRNCWIAGAYDPEFSEKSFVECQSVDELKTKFMQGNWCLGQAFYYQNICFINQVNGGDEWLVIRDDIAFESFTCIRMIEKGEFDEMIERIQKATWEQLKQLDY
ncbi:hypothetical protein BVY01_00190 [bacterium I07]|nr:hypothetical protein BVY01_00190 [bacterium I07]